MDLSEIRKKIDDIDSKLLPLFLERMQISAEVAEYKKAHGLPVLNKGREREILAKVAGASGDMEQYSHRLYSTIFELSRAYQQNLLAGQSNIRREIEKDLHTRIACFPRREGSLVRVLRALMVKWRLTECSLAAT